MAARIAAQQLAEVPEALVTHLDAALRRAWSRHDYATNDAERRAQVALIERLPASAPERNAGLVLMVCHTNGFVRERALAELTALDSAAALAILALRLDDWVAPVRQRAQETWSRLLGQEMLALAVEALPMLHRILEHRRVEAETAWRRLALPLASPEGHRALIAALAGDDPKRSRGAWLTLTKLDSRPEGWLDSALSSSDPWVRLQAVRILAASPEPAGVGSARAMYLTRDAFPSIRRLAVDVVRRHFPALLETVATRGLFDRKATNRQYCQEILILEMERDPVPIYRSSLTETGFQARAVALKGLAETGGWEERGVFEAYLGSPVSTIRAAALDGLARFPQKGDAELFLQRLGDPSASVVRAAEAALRVSAWPTAKLLAAYDKNSIRSAGMALLRLSSKIGAGDRLDLLLRLAGHLDLFVASAARVAIADWVARGWIFSAIPASRKLELSAQLDRTPELHGSRVEKVLRSLLR